MLLPDFYKINNIDSSDSGTTFYISLNPDHDVFKGHFPNQPVLPGVCSLQIIKECAQQLRNTKLQYKQIILCKFLRYVDPVQSNEITLNISFKEKEGELPQMQANGKCGEFDFIKLKAIFA